MKPRHIFATVGALGTTLCSIILLAQDYAAQGQGAIRTQKMVIADGETSAGVNFTWHTRNGHDARMSLVLNETPLPRALHPLAMSLQKTADFVINRTFEDQVNIVNHQDRGGQTRIMVLTGAPVDALQGVIDIKDELAKDILVSLRIEDKTFDEIIDLLSLESGCNIYIDGDKIVVDACGF
jgi:hypothetical protein